MNNIHITHLIYHNISISCLRALFQRVMYFRFGRSACQALGPLENVQQALGKPCPPKNQTLEDQTKPQNQPPERSEINLLALANPPQPVDEKHSDQPEVDSDKDEKQSDEPKDGQKNEPQDGKRNDDEEQRRIEDVKDVTRKGQEEATAPMAEEQKEKVETRRWR